MNRHVRTILQYLFFFGLGFFFVWLSVKDIGKAERMQIRFALRHARYYLAIPVFTILFLSHYVRAMRWRLLISSLGYKPSRANTFFAVMIGYLVNQAVIRLGEVLKCTVLARYEKVPAEKLVGTIILERLVDAITLLIVFAITIILQPGLYQQFVDKVLNDPGEAESKKISGNFILLVITGIVVLLIAGWMIIKKKNFRDLLSGFKKTAKKVWEGISAVQHLKKKKLFILYTVLLWGLYLVAGYIGFFALRETRGYGIKEAFTVLSAGSIGMTITPGGIGGYAYFLEKTMMIHGLSRGVASAFGWLLWLSNTTVVIIGGLVSFAALPLYNKKKLQQSTL
ncbi:MAG: lysylphosphatidylglycerol synthase transmembrane domain-containing protein [Bacteroidota bacterium]|nr:lysylphosphatidylglycerol synthase transmembrane domain-containing protein [Bacteroidota bacterium]